MNVVCVTGRLVEAPPLDLALDPGWATLLLQVQRETPGWREDAGVLNVPLALPPTLAADVTKRLELGTAVAVVGMLDIDVDYSTGTAHAHYAVIVERVERLPSALAEHDAPTPPMEAPGG